MFDNPLNCCAYTRFACYKIHILKSIYNNVVFYFSINFTSFDTSLLIKIQNDKEFVWEQPYQGLGNPSYFLGLCLRVDILLYWFLIGSFDNIFEVTCKRSGWCDYYASFYILSTVLYLLFSPNPG